MPLKLALRHCPRAPAEGGDISGTSGLFLSVICGIANLPRPDNGSTHGYLDRGGGLGVVLLGLGMASE